MSDFYQLLDILKSELNVKMLDFPIAITEKGKLTAMYDKEIKIFLGGDLVDNKKVYDICTEIIKNRLGI